MLEREGYTVSRSAGSKGAFDLVAIKNSQAYIIQVKTERYRLADLSAFEDIACKCGAFAVVAVWKKKKRRFEFLLLSDGVWQATNSLP
jgi:Holliday junction resolvase